MIVVWGLITTAILKGYTDLDEIMFMTASQLVCDIIVQNNNFGKMEISE